MDRTKDMIISGGSNVYPREVEEVLLEHPAVSEAAVIGVPDPEWGESVKAVLVLAPDSEVTGEEIIAYCRERMAPYKRPKSVSFVEELPKSSIDKVLKRALREKFVEQSRADENA
jgi:acyl-CoA synthetase (AMP-forming)/AMP-acid ligase II